MRAAHGLGCDTSTLLWCVSARFCDGLFFVTHLLPDIKTMVRVILLEQTVRCVFRSYCFFFVFLVHSFFICLFCAFGRPNDKIAARDPIKSDERLDVAMTDVANNNFILEKFLAIFFFIFVLRTFYYLRLETIIEVAVDECMRMCVLAIMYMLGW